MKEDPIVKEVRAAGAKIARECGYDLHKMVLRFQRNEKRYKTKFKYVKNVAK